MWQIKKPWTLRYQFASHHGCAADKSCRKCITLSCQYGLKSLRNVSNTLLNLCQEELRQFWRQKRVQPGTSKVYLNKGANGCIYMYVCTLPSKSLETPLAKCGFGRYHTSKHTSKLYPNHTSKLYHKHTSKLCKSYLERKQSAGIMSVMECPL